MQALIRETGAYRLLKTEGEKADFSHAYLLVYEDGRNLRLALKEFAKLLFRCDEDTPAKRRIASLIDNECFVDCVFYPSEGKKLLVEDAERLIEESTLAPVEGDKKVFILSDFAEAMPQVQNKLLKSLEEPPKGVVFLLGTTSAFPVLSTVASRTKKLEIFPFTAEQTVGALERLTGGRYELNALSLCAITAGGNVGDALSMLEGGYYSTLLDNAFDLALCDPSRLPELVKKVGETPYKKELIGCLRLVFRDGLLVKIRTGKPLLIGEKERLQRLASGYSERALLYAQEAFSEAEKQIKFNAVFWQCIELAMAKIITKR